MSETVDSIIDILSERISSAGGIERPVKFLLDETVSIMADANGVRLEEGDADATVIAKADNLEALLKGALNPAMAFMAGKVKIEGDTKVALSLKDILIK